MRKGFLRENKKFFYHFLKYKEFLWGWIFFHIFELEENVEEEYNVEKSLQSCKTPLQKKKSCNKNQEKSNFLFTDKKDDTD